MTARGTHYTIDGAGNVTIDTGSGDSWSYQWDLAGCLTGASHREDGTLSGSVSYTYSPRGLRVTKTGTNGTTVFIYDQWGNVLYEKSGSEYRDYIRAFGASLVRVDGTIDSDIHTATDRYYYHTDHLGTIEAATDASGAGVWTANYSVFGEVLATTGSLDQEPVYTGKGYDDEVGLYYFNARWYNPELGRFISEDPIQDGVNWYVYVSNNPLKFVDPTGLRLDDDLETDLERGRKATVEDDDDDETEGSGNDTNSRQKTEQATIPELPNWNKLLDNNSMMYFDIVGIDGEEPTLYTFEYFRSNIDFKDFLDRFIQEKEALDTLNESKFTNNPSAIPSEPDWMASIESWWEKEPGAPLTAREAQVQTIFGISEMVVGGAGIIAGPASGKPALVFPSLNLMADGGNLVSEAKAGSKARPLDMFMDLAMPINIGRFNFVSPLP